MSGTAGPPTAVLGLGLDVGGPWHQGAVQRSRALVQTYLHGSSVNSPSTAGRGSRGTKTPLRLPSLVASAKGPHRRSTMARLSLSEPSLLIPNEKELFEGVSANRRHSLFQKQPPPPSSLSESSALISYRTCRQSGTSLSHQQQVQSCCGPAYIHFSQAIQLGSRPRPVRRHSHNPAPALGDLRPSQMQGRDMPLSVIGKPCLPSCNQRPATSDATAAPGPVRPQLHVFLPTEAEREVDSESVDEGFMDELDTKKTSLMFQQGAPNAVSHNRLTKTN
ncbi:hypothetical protein Q5P01_018651 [Channa striata]|uniref:Uncharacterized protein n=1 Tax=Channa striata TaxID=64152 RepID=A0AA88S8M4_CHASR|nr:hypothetical protein Q5P01_018651 [Channa striata]